MASSPVDSYRRYEEQDDDSSITRNDSITSRQNDIDVAQDIDFDEIYEKRYQKYLQLRAKEQELLRRMTGRRRRQRSSTLGNGLDIDDLTFSESDYTEDEKESCFYRPLTRQRQHHKQHALVRKSSSVKDLSRTSPIFARSPPPPALERNPQDPSHLYFSQRAKKRLSVKIEMNENEDGDISDNSSSSSLSSFSSSPQLPHRALRAQPLRSLRSSSNFTHTRSVDNLYSPPQTRRVLPRMRSCEDLLSDDSLSSSFSNLNLRRRSSKKSMPRRVLPRMRSCEDILSDDSQSSNFSSRNTRRGSKNSVIPQRMIPPRMRSCEDLFSDDSMSSTLSSLNIRRSSHQMPTVPLSASLMRLRDSTLTSSYRNLADRNVRETHNSTSPPKTLKTSSPYLARRLAEAKERNTKRAEALRSLDTDFTRAKEIMKRYNKSTENLPQQVTSI